MVRFIIPNAHTVNALLSNIYIPIWLDLLYKERIEELKNISRFTFQYG